MRPDRIASAHSGRALRCAAAAFLLAAPGFAAHADRTDSADTDGSRWEVALTPYAWGIAIHGDIDVGRVQPHFSASFADLLDDLNFAAMALVDVRRDRFVAALDVLWADLEDERAGLHRLRIQADTQAQQLIADGKLGYRVWRRGWDGGAAPDWATSRDRLALDLLAGARYLRFDARVDLSGARFSRDASRAVDWVDPVLGFRFRSVWADGIFFSLRADAGGFDIGNASKFTWSGSAALGFRLSRHWTLSAGYKVLQIDRDDIDLWEQGPLLGLTYAF